MTGAKTPRYRLCFDFGDAEHLFEFWESFKESNLSPDGLDWRTCEVIHKDDLHDRNYKVTTFLIREQNKHFGNGRPTKHTKVSTAGDSTGPKPGQVTNK